jgi:hypothetical protein
MPAAPIVGFGLKRLGCTHNVCTNHTNPPYLQVLYVRANCPGRGTSPCGRPEPYSGSECQHTHESKHSRDSLPYYGQDEPFTPASPTHSIGDAHAACAMTHEAMCPCRVSKLNDNRAPKNHNRVKRDPVSCVCRVCGVALGYGTSRLQLGTVLVRTRLRCSCTVYTIQYTRLQGTGDRPGSRGLAHNAKTWNRSMHDPALPSSTAHLVPRRQMR